MTRDELVAALKEIRANREHTDEAWEHQRADELLIEYISDPQITEAYDAIRPKWYE